MGRVSPRGWQKCAGIIPLPTVGYGKNLLRGESERELLPRGQEHGGQRDKKEVRNGKS